MIAPLAFEEAPARPSAGAPSLSGAFSSREPVSTSRENALILLTCLVHGRIVVRPAAMHDRLGAWRRQRTILHEAVEDIADQFRDVVVAVVPGQRAAEGDRRKRKGCAAVRCLVIGDIRAHARMLGAIEPLLVEAVVLHDQQVAFGMTAG